MHPNALDKVQKKVEGSLKNCQVLDSWPQFESFEVHVKSLAEEVLKHKKEWLTVSDVFFIFYDLVYEELSATRKPVYELVGNLWDLLGENTSQQLKKTLVEFYDSIPRDYDVFIPTPTIPVDIKPISLSDKLAIVTYDNKKDVPGGYPTGLLGVRPRLDPKLSYFRYSISGYCGRNLEGKTLRRSLSNFKIAFQQGISKGIFDITEGKPSGLGLLAHYQVQKANLVSIDKTGNTQRVVSTELPLDVCKFLDSIVVNPSLKGPLAELKNQDASAIFEFNFRHPAMLIENTTDEAVRVKSAIEWCFDSYATENVTMSFLQTCFGLEALFGDDAASEALTKTLADRCAYFVGSNIKGRKTIREKFKELYAIRSRLVHGSATSLGHDERNYLNWGRTILERSISKEIKYLGMDKI